MSEAGVIVIGSGSISMETFRRLAEYLRENDIKSEYVEIECSFPVAYLTIDRNPPCPSNYRVFSPCPSLRRSLKSLCRSNFAAYKIGKSRKWKGLRVKRPKSLRERFPVVAELLDMETMLDEDPAGDIYFACAGLGLDLYHEM